MNTAESIIPEKVKFAAEQVRPLFPILNQTIYGNKQLVYLDNAATTQKPQCVIDSITNYYTHYNANIHRGVHYLSQKASAEYDEVRNKIAKFINASTEREIIFTSGTTDGINLVASSFSKKYIQAGDEIVITAMEHHSNIVPWQIICEERGAVLKVIPMSDQGELITSNLDQYITSKTKLVSAVYISNSLGTINPVKLLIDKAHQLGAKVLIDAAQAIAHAQIDVQELDADFMVASAHKFFGPTGTGFLYGKLDLLDTMPPYKGGGDMISSVSFEKTTYNEVPFKFEAGTPNIEGVIAMGTAIDFMSSFDLNEICAHENALVKVASEGLSNIPKVKLIGTAKEKASVVSFIIEGTNAMDAGMLLDSMGIAVRTGQHCTEPVMDRLGIKGTIRASFSMYNTIEDVNALIAGVKRAVDIL